MDFCITRQINTRNYNVFIDDNKGNFTVARKLDVNENPDIVPLSGIVQCRVDVDQQQQEETYTKDGETVSYQPPVYKYEFDYTMRIKVRTQWFDDMDFRLNTFSISSDNRRELMEVEQTAYQIIAALTPNAAGMQPGMPGMNMNGGMQPGMPGMNMNGGPESRMYSALLGAFSMALLDSFMNIFVTGSWYLQIVKGTLFIAVVTLFSVGNRSRVLKR